MNKHSNVTLASKEKEIKIYQNELREKEQNENLLNEKIDIMDREKDSLRASLGEKESEVAKNNEKLNMEIERMKMISNKNKEIFFKQKESNADLKVKIEELNDTIEDKNIEIENLEEELKSKIEQINILKKENEHGYILENCGEIENDIPNNDVEDDDFPEEIIECDSCDFTTLQEFILKLHKKNCQQLKHKCDKCKSRFTTVGLLKRHTKTSH